MITVSSDSDHSEPCQPGDHDVDLACPVLPTVWQPGEQHAGYPADGSGADILPTASATAMIQEMQHAIQEEEQERERNVAKEVELQERKRREEEMASQKREEEREDERVRKKVDEWHNEIREEQEAKWRAKKRKHGPGADRSDDAECKMETREPIVSTGASASCSSIYDMADPLVEESQAMPADTLVVPGSVTSATDAREASLGEFLVGFREVHKKETQESYAPEAASSVSECGAPASTQSATVPDCMAQKIAIELQGYRARF